MAHSNSYGLSGSAIEYELHDPISSATVSEELESDFAQLTIPINC